MNTKTIPGLGQRHRNLSPDRHRKRTHTHPKAQVSARGLSSWWNPQAKQGLVDTCSDRPGPACGSDRMGWGELTGAASEGSQAGAQAHVWAVGTHWGLGPRTLP